MTSWLVHNGGAGTWFFVGEIGAKADRRLWREEGTESTLKTSSAIHAEALPIHAEPLPIHAEPLPIHAEPLPIHAEALPIHAEPLPIHAEALPIHAEPLPIHAEAWRIEQKMQTRHTFSPKRDKVGNHGRHLVPQH